MEREKATSNSERGSDALYILFLRADGEMGVLYDLMAAASGNGNRIERRRENEQRKNT